jgi:hypothetical protein
MMLRTVRAIRYLMPFRQGGSVPALVEADDAGMYVVKLRGAAQGEKALVAELVAGELARAYGLSVPELVMIDIDAAIAASEPDPELCMPLERSIGRNLGLDFLPGSVTYDPLVGPHPDALSASKIVLFDAFVANVDRTVRNANLLSWHKDTWLIDQGAALYFHHAWSSAAPLLDVGDAFAEVKQHVLLRRATELGAAADTLRASFDDATIERIVSSIPDLWLANDHSFDSPQDQRVAYRQWLIARKATIEALVRQAEAARA